MSTFIVLLLVIGFVYMVISEDFNSNAMDVRLNAERTRANYTVELMRARRTRVKALSECIYWSERVDATYGVQFEVCMAKREAACTAYAEANAKVQVLVYMACDAYAVIK